MPDPYAAHRLVFLHGFTQTHHHWHGPARAIADAIGSQPSLAFVDLPGHGLSHADRTGIEEAAETLPAIAGPGTWIGYSMGARCALLAALNQPAEIERLVLVGGTAGIADPAERAERGGLDEARAEHIERVGVDTFVEEWMAQPMFTGLPDDRLDVAHRRRNTVEGLAHSLRTAGTGRQPSIWDRLDHVRQPTLVLAGERDVKFSEIGHAMADRLPHGTFLAIAKAGHAAHIEQPGYVAAAIAEWSADM